MSTSDHHFSFVDRWKLCVRLWKWNEGQTNVRFFAAFNLFNLIYFVLFSQFFFYLRKCRLFFFKNWKLSKHLYVRAWLLDGGYQTIIRELKQQRFWATHVNRKWPFLIFWRWFRANFQSNRLYNSKEAKEYKFYITKAC